MENVIVMALGDTCPIPVVKTMKALTTLTESAVIETHVDNEVAVQNLNRYAVGQNLPVTSEKVDEKHFIVKITVNDPVNLADVENAHDCIPDMKSNSVVVIGSECMGSGDDKLGATLMKGFLYAISQQQELPRTILFYNGGAKLTVEGSVSVDDLKNMEAQGVEVLTCGTCLNFYGLEDKLAVGKVTNMYDIVAHIFSATKVIRP